MTALRRKLLRDLRRQWSQVLSIAAVVGCGIMAALGMRSTLESVRAARDDYYARHRFADVFATLERAPSSLERRIAALPGVGAVQTRVALRVVLDVPGLDEPATGQLVSVRADPRPAPNELYLRRGRWVARDAADEALVSERFADENALRPGATIGAVINGQWRRLRIVGIATSPEYVYEIGAGGFLVDNRRFGVLWMDRDAVERAAGLSGAFNDVALTLAPQASEDDVIARLDALLAPYGGTGAYPRADQLSNNVIADELRQLAAIGTLFPVFFIVTSAFLLHIVLSRLITTQRDEIAALKAFGYRDLEVGLHYLGFALAAVAAGTALGVAGGIWLGGRYTALYAAVFRFPMLHHQTDWAVAAAAAAVSGGAALAGALGAVWAAVRVPPAEALRPPSPGRYRPLLAERLGFGAAISPSAKMVLRTLERRPWRTLASVAGVGLAGGVIVAGLSPWDSVQRLMDVQFEQVQREELTVAFTSARSARAARELAGMTGVTRAEPFRSAAVRLRHGHHARNVQLLGLEPTGTLRQLMDFEGRRHRLPPAGLVLSAGLASALGAAPGDTLVAELLAQGGVARRVVVAATIPEMVGSGGYLERSALNRLLREGDVVSGAYLSIERGAERAVYARLKRLPRVAGSSSRRAMLDNFRRTMAENIAASVGIILFAGCVLAAGVIYNQARIALSERGRELASLRVLGFTRAEVRAMLLGEQAFVTAVGIPLGFAIGAALGALLMKMFEAERHRFPVVVSGRTYVVSALIVAVSAAAATIAVRRRADRLDLVAVLKTRE